MFLIFKKVFDSSKITISGLSKSVLINKYATLWRTHRCGNLNSSYRIRLIILLLYRHFVICELQIQYHLNKTMISDICRRWYFPIRKGFSEL